MQNSKIGTSIFVVENELQRFQLMPFSCSKGYCKVFKHLLETTLEPFLPKPLIALIASYPLILELPINIDKWSSDDVVLWVQFQIHWTLGKNFKNASGAKFLQLSQETLEKEYGITSTKHRQAIKEFQSKKTSSFRKSTSLADNYDASNLVNSTATDYSQNVPNQNMPVLSSLPKISTNEKPFRSKLVSQWKVADVTDWLVHVELDEIVQIFQEQSVDGGLLLTLSESDLFELKVTKFGHRKKIRNLQQQAGEFRQITA